MFPTIFNRLLNLAAEQNISELYLFPGAYPFAKKEGTFISLEKKEIVDINFIQEFLGSLLDKKQEEELLKKKEFSTIYDFSRFRLIIHIFFQKDNPSLIFKLIYPEFKTLDQLDLPPAVKKFSQLEKGLVLISGPKNSGKSTLLSAFINQINKDHFKHLATLEDPIENIFAPDKSIIEQRELNRDVPSLFQGLKSLQKRKVDVVFISSLPFSLKIIREIIFLAESGKLVFSVLETTLSAPQIIERIINLSQEKDELIKGLLSANLKTIINLRLLSKIGGGKILVPEILINTPAMSAAIREKKIERLNALLQMGESEGMISLDRSLLKLVKDNEITVSEALKHCFSEENLKIILREQ